MSANNKGVPGAGRGAAKDVSYGRDCRAAVIEWCSRTTVRKRQPILAYAVGSTCSSPAGTPRKQARPIAPSDRMAEDAHEKGRGRPVAQSNQMASGAGQKLI